MSLLKIYGIIKMCSYKCYARYLVLFICFKNQNYNDVVEN